MSPSAQNLRNFPDITSFLYSDNLGNKISIKRDDLIPFSFGGNKAVIAEAQIEDMVKKGCDIMVGYGNSRSNLCRVLSNMCKAGKIPCKIIAPLDENGGYTPSYNAAFSALSDADILHCKKSEAGAFIAQVKADLIQKGHRPYFVYDIDKIPAPVKAISTRYDGLSEHYDMIFLATGTGITVSGILLGHIREILSGKTPSDCRTSRTVSISIARNREREMPVISSYLRATDPEAAKWFDQNGSRIFDFCDSFIGNGYGASNNEINNIIDTLYSDFGIPLDPTYTGKAFYGMTEYLKVNNIRKQNILFWHTGGLPLFFDHKEKM